MPASLVAPPSEELPPSVVPASPVPELFGEQAECIERLATARAISPNEARASERETGVICTPPSYETRGPFG